MELDSQRRDSSCTSALLSPSSLCVWPMVLCPGSSRTGSRWGGSVLRGSYHGHDLKRICFDHVFLNMFAKVDDTFLLKNENTFSREIKFSEKQSIKCVSYQKTCSYTYQSETFLANQHLSSRLPKFYIENVQSQTRMFSTK